MGDLKIGVHKEEAVESVPRLSRELEELQGTIKMLATRHSISEGAVIDCLMAGREIGHHETSCRGERRLAQLDDPALAIAVVSSVPDVKLVLGRGFEVHPERVLDDQEFYQMMRQVEMVLKAARAVLPPQPVVCDGCRDAYPPRFTQGGVPLRRY